MVRRERQLEALGTTYSQKRRSELSIERWMLNVWRFVQLLTVVAIALSFPSHSFAEPSPAPQDPPRNLAVLILGDSLSLCGFGKRLDKEFRADPRFKSVFTYITCGTNPLSWLKVKPYDHVQTYCGFWSIESLPDSESFKQVTDVYGMTAGHRPKSHPVPKLEDLLATIQPDILVMQTGGNLFGLFSGREKVNPDRDAAALRKYLMPFVKKATAPPSKLRRIYWVAPPTSGRVSGEVQTFVFDQTQQDIGGVAKVIDSRRLVSYPYKHMEPDHEHFIGEDMDTWTDRVFGIIEQDLSAQPWSNLKPLSEVLASAPTATPHEISKTPTLVVQAKLVSKSKPIPREELLPYQEFLVGFIYDVEEVIEGEYTDKQILVMHPAYIGLRRQSLGRYHVDRTYYLKLRELEGSLWSTVKSKDDSGGIDLQPYIRIQDEARYPESAR